MNRHDIGMSEAGEDGRFATEARDVRGGGLETRRLDGDRLIEPHVVPEKHGAHAPAPDLPLKGVVGCQCTAQPLFKGGHGPGPLTFGPAGGKSNGPGILPGAVVDSGCGRYFTVIAIFIPSAACGRQ